MKIDLGSIFTMAAMSLLTGDVVCTEPTEMEEVTKRAKNLRKMLASKGHEIVDCFNALEPSFPEDKWPFATSKKDFEMAMYDFSNNRKYPGVNSVNFDELKEALADPEIESKYRLSKVKDSTIETEVLPF